MDGNAIVYCEGAFNTTNGKTAHGLVRFTERYQVLGVIDSRYSGQDSGFILDARANGIPIFAGIKEAIYQTGKAGRPEYLVIGLAPDGGRLNPLARKDILVALEHGLNIDCGLHDYLSDDPVISAVAARLGIQVRDIRKTPPLNSLHFFSGKIEQVDSLKIAVLGTDSAVGKRTTAWKIVHGFRNAELKAEMVGTGQTAWMQGVKYGFILDTMINDFLSGEIEHAVYSAWEAEKPDVIVLEGQGSLMNPAYPGGYELLAAGRPDIVVLQHAPARKEYDGFPGYPIQPILHQIKAIEVVSGKKVAAITINHENIAPENIHAVCRDIELETGLPAFDVLQQGAGDLVTELLRYMPCKV